MWDYFKKGSIENPYSYNIYGVAARGIKYPAKINGIIQKEYDTWIGMIRRCYDKKTKKKTSAYQDITCCDEWLLYENFYEWLHSQENFDKWYSGNRWAVDKDIVFTDDTITNIFCGLEDDTDDVKISRAIFRDFKLTKDSKKELEDILMV